MFVAVKKLKPTYLSLLKFLWNNSSIWFLVAIAVTYAVYCATRDRQELFVHAVEILRLLLLTSLATMPKKRSSKILLISASVFCLLYITTVLSEFTSLLISPKSNQIMTIDEFVDMGYTLMVQNTSVLPLELFKGQIISPENVWGIYHLEQNEFFKRNPLLGFVNPKSSHALRALEDFHVIPQELSTVYEAYQIPRQSPFYGTVNDILFRYFEGDLMGYLECRFLAKHWVIQWQKYPPQTELVSSNQIITIGAYLLIFGNGAAAIVWIFEIFVSKVFPSLTALNLKTLLNRCKIMLNR